MKIAELRKTARLAAYLFATGFSDRKQQTLMIDICGGHERVGLIDEK
jgi:hypothetical protein